MPRMPVAWTRSVLLLLITAVAYSQTWIDLWPLWENKNATYTHGVLIAALFLWLVWRTRSALLDVPAQADIRLLPLVVIVSLAWLVTARANSMILYTVLWPVVAFAALWAGLGWAVARLFAFPLAFLYFAIPIWDYFEPALQWVASHMVGAMIGLFGTQASVDGPYILLPQVTIFIALTCSGAHFLAVSLAMGALAGEIRQDRLRTRLLILLLAGLLSIAFNAVRIMLIVLAYLSPGLRAGFEAIGHITFGWWVFALDILVFYLALRLVPWSQPPASPAASRSASSWRPTGRAGYVLAVVSVLLLPLSSLAAQHLSHYPAPLGEPPVLAGVVGPIPADSRWQPEFTGAAWEHRVSYLMPSGRVVELYRNEYHRQSQGEELVSNGTHLFDPADYSIEDSGTESLRTTGATPAAAWKLHLRDNAGREWSAIYTYVTDDGYERDARRVQWSTAWRALRGRPTAGIFAVATVCIPDCGAAEADLLQLAQAAANGYESKRSRP